MGVKYNFCAVLFVAILSLGNADYYSATTSLEKLLRVEKFMIELLENYMKAEHNRNSYLRDFLAFAQREAENAKVNNLKYFGNPLNAWKTLKRLSREWRDYYNSHMTTVNEDEYMKRLGTYGNELGFTKPEENDLLGAAKGVARLQSTYNLDTTDLANGTIVDRQYSRPLFATDCFDLGVSLMKSNDFKNAATWLLEARRRLAKETEKDKQSKVSKFPVIKDDMILDYLIPTMLKNGHTKLALWLVKEQLTNSPYHSPALENLKKIEYQMNQERVLLTKTDTLQPVQKPDTLMEMYEKTCRGEYTQTPREKRKLRCRYVHNNVPFCFIAPFKMEELSLDPFMAYYHEVIFESEIKKIFEAAQGKVIRSKVGGSTAGQVSDIRTSKNTWLWYHQNEFLKPIARRLTDITGLSLVTAEALQVANYGIGGHYGPHYDFTEDVNYDYNGIGNRILTALFYINDVEYGGATAFPYLRLAVPPIKRSLVVWHNLHRSLELDYRMKHAGCPVIKGSKWICNEWYHAIGQEFLRPCGLEPDGHKSAQFYKLGE